MKKHKVTSKVLNIDSSSALFLDRDGVINRRLPGTYVRDIREFEFLPGVLEAVRILSGIFPYVFVVTNQQGIGKGFMTEAALNRLHAYMLEEIERHGGRIDKIYFAPQLEAENHIMRKPNPGMAFAALRDFPGVDLSRSIMVGDSPSDMLFGVNAGMQNVLISEVEPQDKDIPYLLRFNSLYEFARYLSGDVQENRSHIAKQTR